MMKTRKYLFIIVFTLIIALNVTNIASANGGEPPIPSLDCGTYTDLRTGPGNFGNYSAEWFEVDVSILITSFDGWTFVEGAWLDWDEVPIVLFTFSPGSTSEIIPLPADGAAYSSVTLRKSCSCQLTGRYVYTLLGNYPCNLVVEEKTIPARFLNPDYTAPLCNLPTIDHEWNGEWVKNKELNCGGYLVGGNHYDTSLGDLP